MSNCGGSVNSFTAPEGSLVSVYFNDNEYSGYIDGNTYYNPNFKTQMTPELEEALKKSREEQEKIWKSNE